MLIGKITKYITGINRTQEYCYKTFKEVVIFKFFGDGEGDYGEAGDSATEECLKDYIKYCETQIKHAKEYLEEGKK